MIGCSPSNPQDDDDDDESELLYGCTVAVEKAHFVRLALLLHPRTSPPTASEWCSYASDAVLSSP